jgi:hypothetical protein
MLLLHVRKGTLFDASGRHPGTCYRACAVYAKLSHGTPNAPGPEICDPTSFFIAAQF